MTTPSFIMFKADLQDSRPCLAVGAHLYATAQRGAIVEAMFARVTHKDLKRDLDLWVYGKKRSLVRGSGVYVGLEGVTCDHHFLLPEGEEKFDWETGEYIVEIFGAIVGRQRLHRFFETSVFLKKKIEAAGDSTFFDWQPAKSRYKGRAIPRLQTASAHQMLHTKANSYFGEHSEDSQES